MIPSDMGGANASPDMSSLIDSTVTETAEPDVTDAAEPVEAAASEEQEPAESAVEAPPVEPEPVAAEPEGEQPDEFENDDLSKPDRMSRDGKLYYYKPQRIQKFLQSHQAWQAIQDAVPGASVDTVKAMYETTAGVEALQADFHAGNIDPFVEFWRGENPQSFTQMMMNAPRYLEQHNPRALQALEYRVNGTLVDRLYREGQQSGDDTKIAIAQHLDKILTGKFRDLTRGPAQDPLAEREAEISRREQTIQQQLQRERSERLAAWMEQTDNTVQQAASDLVAKAVARPELKVFEGKREMTWIKRDLEEAIQKAERTNVTWKRQYDALRKQAEVRPSEESRKTLVEMKEQFARTVIAKTLPAIITAATGRVMSKSAATHSRMQQAATKTEPANAGAPVQGVPVNPKVRDAKTMDDLLKAVLG